MHSRNDPKKYLASSSPRAITCDNIRAHMMCIMFSVRKSFSYSCFLIWWFILSRLKKMNKPFEKMNKPLQWFSLFFFFCMDKQANSCFSLRWLRQSRRPWIFDCVSIRVEMNMNVQQLLVIHPIIQILLSSVKSSTIFCAIFLYILQVHVLADQRKNIKWFGVQLLMQFQILLK